MQIIPHNRAFVQVEICPKNKRFSKSSVSNSKTTFSLTYLQQHALSLYDSGLNVFPQPIGTKGGYPWKQLQYTRLDREDQLHGLLPLFAGQCNIAVMCGRTSGNLFVIDCESPQSFEYHCNQLEQRDIPIWSVQTARGGHIYLRCAEGEVNNIKPGVLKDTEIKGSQGYVLAPPSRHPNGTRYSWIRQDSDIIPVISTQNIDWLSDRNGKPIQLTYKPTSSDNNVPVWKLSHYTNRLSKQTMNYIKQGHLIQEGSRNNELFRAACDLAGNNYKEEEAYRLLIDNAKLSGLSFTEISRTIRSAFSQQREPSVKVSAHSENWEYAFYYLTQKKWSGRGSNSKRALMLALIESARRSQNPNGIFRASIRELSQLARIGTATVQRLLPTFQLKNQPILFHYGYDQTSKATLWKFSNHVLQLGKSIKLNMDTSPLLPPWLSYSVSVFNSDVAERSALGLGGLYLYMMLQSQKKPLMPSAIADLVSMTVNQVNYALSKLRQFGLVLREKAGWFVEQLADLDQVARDAGVLGKGKARMARYGLERATFVGRSVLNARLKRENQSFFRFFRQVSGQMSQYAQQIGAFLRDPLISDSLILGGSVEIEVI